MDYELLTDFAGFDGHQIRRAAVIDHLRNRYFWDVYKDPWGNDNFINYVPDFPDLTDLCTLQIPRLPEGNLRLYALTQLHLQGKASIKAIINFIKEKLKKYDHADHETSGRK